MMWAIGAQAQECEQASRNHAPVVVEYGGAGRITYTPSGDGTLRATAENGTTLWTFTIDEAGSASTHGNSMTGIRVLRFDANLDGIIDVSSGDKVWLYFGSQQGGAFYYALDVTDPGVARVLWKIGADVLHGAGEAWSTPTVARVRIAGASQNGEHFVLILGGGYDANPNQKGNRIFMVDAATGHLQWFAGGAQSTAGAGNAGTPDLVLALMSQPIPARVAVVDTDGDGFADRLYVGDLGGQLWRFDIWNGHGRADLVTGGVFASLSTPSPGEPTAGQADTRRFFSAPDIALIQRRGAYPYYNVAIGSGDMVSLDAKSIRDRFYSIRDRNPFAGLAQRDYDQLQPILDTDLFDITASLADARIPPEAPGWKLDLGSNGDAPGEKVLGDALTVNGVILFSTYQPLNTTGTPACAAGGAGRVYAVKVDTGSAALDLDDDEHITAADRSMSLPLGGVPGELSIQLGGGSTAPPSGPEAGTPGDPSTGGEGGAPLPAGHTMCLVGAQVLARCVPFGTLIRTFWQRQSVN